MFGIYCSDHEIFIMNIYNHVTLAVLNHENLELYSNS